MRLVRENALRPLFTQAGFDWDATHLLVLEAKGILLDREDLTIEQVVSQLIGREQSKAA